MEYRGGFNEIIQEFQHEVVPCVGYREILRKKLVQPLIDPVFRICFQLEKILEGLDLNIKKIRILGPES